MDKSVDFDWIGKTGDESAASLFALMRYWDQSVPHIQQQNLRNLRIYSNKELQSLSIANWVLANQTDAANTAGVGWNRPLRLTLNVTRSIIDTLVSKMAKNRVKPTFLTTGGAFEAQKRAKKLNQFMNGLFLESGFHSIAPKCFRDSGIFGNGFSRPFMHARTGKVRFERIFPDEIFCDPADGYYGTPRTEYMRKFVSRAAMMAQYKGKEDLLRKVPNVNLTYSGQSTDTILAVEAWHMPRVKGAKGRHVICSDRVMLMEESFDDDESPLVRLYYNEPVLGFFGTGVVDELVGIQIEINRLLYHVQECMRLIPFPRIFVDMASKVNPRHFTNEIGTFIFYTGQAPIISSPNSVSPEIFSQINTLYGRAFEIAGLSQLSAQSQKPAGLNSGKALREFTDIESERFAYLQQQYEKFAIDNTRRVVAMLPDSYSVCSPKKGIGAERLTWGDIKIDEDDYILQAFPTSILPAHPGARLEAVSELRNGGYIDPDDAADLLDFPDIEGRMQQQLAPVRLIRQQLENILVEGQYSEPDPNLPIGLAKKHAQQMWAYAVLNEAPEKRQEMLIRYIDDCTAMEEMARQQAQAAAMMAGAGPVSIAQRVSEGAVPAAPAPILQPGLA